MDRRRQNVSNYGSSWLKPPGVPKTLFQMREERREAEEHAEQVRREQQLAAALEAEAEAGAVGGGPGVGGGGVELEPMEGDEEEVEEQDLDDEIPEAEGFGFDGEESEEEEEEEEEEENDEDEENENERGGGDGSDHAIALLSSATAEQEREVRDMRAAEDRMRELMARGHDDVPGNGDPFLDAGDADNYNSFHYEQDDERAGQMLEEDDLVHRHQQQEDDANVGDTSMGMDMDMEADLDDEIPDADADDGGHSYEHTDSEDISDDDDGTREISFAGRSSGSVRTSAIRRRAPRDMLRQSLQSRTSLAQSDIDISSLLSRDGSSFLGDTPQTGRRRGP